MRTNHEPRNITGGWQTAMGHISGLLTVARSDLKQPSGLKAILALEQTDNCGCRASQVRGCDDTGKNIDTVAQTLIDEIKGTLSKNGNL